MTIFEFLTVVLWITIGLLAGSSLYDLVKSWRLK